GERAREIIKRQLFNLSQLVEDLVDTTRITTGKISLNSTAINLAEGVTRCLKTLEIAGRTNGYELRVDTEETWVFADSARIDQVLSNLLGNALKYTPSGGRIMVRVRAEEDRGLCEISAPGRGVARAAAQG